MTTATLDVFEKSIEKTHHWLQEIMTQLDWTDRHKAYVALRSTLHTLRDRLSVDEAAQVSAQLPMLIRGLFFEGWKPSNKPTRIRHKDEFIQAVEHDARMDFNTDPEQVVRAVFSVLVHHVTSGEITDIKRILPEEVRDLMPTAD